MSKKGQDMEDVELRPISRTHFLHPKFGGDPVRCPDKLAAPPLQSHDMLPFPFGFPCQ